MNSIAQQYVAQYGDEAGAIQALVDDLVRGDASTFKAGYTLENAIIAVSDAFGVSRDEVRAHIGDGGLALPRPADPDIVLILGGVSAITKTVKGEIVETVEWASDGKPDWEHYGICDPRGTSFEAFGHLVSAFEHAEQNYREVFGTAPDLLPD